VRPSSLPDIRADRRPTGFTDPRLLHELAERLWQFQPLRGWRVRQEALVNPKRQILFAANGTVINANTVTSFNLNAQPAFTLNDGDAIWIEDLNCALQSSQANPAAGTAPGLTLLAYSLYIAFGGFTVMVLPVDGPLIASATVGSPIFNGPGNNQGSVPIRLAPTPGGGHGYVVSAEEILQFASRAGQPQLLPLTFNLILQLTIANSTAGGLTANTTITGLFRKFEGVESA